MKSTNASKRHHRHARVRAKVNGTEKRPRLVVFRSINSTYAQLIDDTTGAVICATSDLKKDKGNKIERAKEVGLEIGKLAQDKGIKECVFDRNGYRYHGRVKAIADGARESGLAF
ncbi:50S ribosomal protein L18 [Candidatus Peregrinibacteria bacterium CG22_combo_CG10-13_8_21_14_all_44_10]|nr:MAG: 50S ribosomal protein L18 [Candidatus Peregrinibacteria bacterium CG2_30_44_17]PIP66066.1 MAG: 50S ribosomal protein L18 [Candidatus Peregrinibacteria bacterium CG22_combo_CG10-13_8_21_14_all_44_10]PIS03618.1 MAG: 50S ribosomal protein L18 [Candidatus Peregrinibacteria bacterium CG10_big_fil_rev_8_21_14_0_10_44_7]PIX78880.1 MAG: 50S ribosomal protein L18 [Candidatus Peregrinibacteria bacterium CG_4_10_14_3_um_filter_44_21]PJB88869.1 MAG: 50S ribosomal protein L18 [Candidatus Peregriniba